MDADVAKSYSELRDLNIAARNLKLSEILGCNAENITQCPAGRKLQQKRQTRDLSAPRRRSSRLSLKKSITNMSENVDSDSASSHGSSGEAMRQRISGASSEEDDELIGLHPRHASAGIQAPATMTVCYDRNGFSPAGFDREGYDRDGYDAEGYDRQGYGRPEPIVNRPTSEPNSLKHKAQILKSHRAKAAEDDSVKSKATGGSGGHSGRISTPGTSGSKAASVLDASPVLHSSRHSTPLGSESTGLMAGTGSQSTSISAIKKKISSDKKKANARDRSKKRALARELAGKPFYEVTPDADGSIVSGCQGKDWWLRCLKQVVFSATSLDQTDVCFTEKHSIVKIIKNRMDEMFEYHGRPVSIGHLVYRINRTVVEARAECKKLWVAEGRPRVEDPWAPEKVGKMVVKRAEWQHLKKYWLSPEGIERGENAEVARASVVSPSTFGRGGKATVKELLKYENDERTPTTEELNRKTQECVAEAGRKGAPRKSIASSVKDLAADQSKLRSDVAKYQKGMEGRMDGLETLLKDAITLMKGKGNEGTNNAVPAEHNTGAASTWTGAVGVHLQRTHQTSPSEEDTDFHVLDSTSSLQEPPNLKHDEGSVQEGTHDAMDFIVENEPAEVKSAEDDDNADQSGEVSKLGGLEVTGAQISSVKDKEAERPTQQAARSNEPKGTVARMDSSDLPFDPMTMSQAPSKKAPAPAPASQKSGVESKRKPSTQGAKADQKRKTRGALASKPVDYGFKKQRVSKPNVKPNVKPGHHSTSDSITHSFHSTEVKVGEKVDLYVAGDVDGQKKQIGHGSVHALAGGSCHNMLIKEGFVSVLVNHIIPAAADEIPLWVPVPNSDLEWVDQAQGSFVQWPIRYVKVST